MESVLNVKSENAEIQGEPQNSTCYTKDTQTFAGRWEKF
jgi:hypothetical protein